MYLPLRPVNRPVLVLGSILCRALAAITSFNSESLRFLDRFGYIPVDMLKFTRNVGEFLESCYEEIKEEVNFNCQSLFFLLNDDAAAVLNSFSSNLSMFSQALLATLQKKVTFITNTNPIQLSFIELSDCISEAQKDPLTAKYVILFTAPAEWAKSLAQGGNFNVLKRHVSEFRAKKNLSILAKDDSLVKGADVVFFGHFPSQPLYLNFFIDRGLVGDVTLKTKTKGKRKENVIIIDSVEKEDKMKNEKVDFGFLRKFNSENDLHALTKSRDPVILYLEFDFEREVSSSILNECFLDRIFSHICYLNEVFEAKRDSAKMYQLSADQDIKEGDEMKKMVDPEQKEVEGRAYKRKAFESEDYNIFEIISTKKLMKMRPIWYYGLASSIKKTAALDPNSAVANFGKHYSWKSSRWRNRTFVAPRNPHINFDEQMAPYKFYAESDDAYKRLIQASISFGENFLHFLEAPYSPECDKALFLIKHEEEVEKMEEEVFSEDFEEDFRYTEDPMFDCADMDLEKFLEHCNLITSHLSMHEFKFTCIVTVSPEVLIKAFTTLYSIPVFNKLIPSILIRLMDFYDCSNSDFLTDVYPRLSLAEKLYFLNTFSNTCLLKVSDELFASIFKPDDVASMPDWFLEDLSIEKFKGLEPAVFAVARPNQIHKLKTKCALLSAEQFLSIPLDKFSSFSTNCVLQLKAPEVWKEMDSARLNMLNRPHIWEVVSFDSFSSLSEEAKREFPYYSWLGRIQKDSPSHPCRNIDVALVASMANTTVKDAFMSNCGKMNPEKFSQIPHSHSSTNLPSLIALLICTFLALQLNLN